MASYPVGGDGTRGEKYQYYTQKVNKGLDVEPQTDDLYIAVIGKTGNGKSATANSVIGDNVFKASMSSQSGTSESCVRTTETDTGRKIHVLDTPGLADTDTGDKAIMQQIARAAFLFHKGIHAFLLVKSAANPRHTQEEKDAIKKLQGIFKSPYRHYCVMVYTRADAGLDSECNLDQFIKEQKENPELGKLLDELTWRVTAVNNSTRIPAEKKRNQDAVVKMVDKLIMENEKANRPELYSLGIFESADRQITELAKSVPGCPTVIVAAGVDVYFTLAWYQKIGNLEFQNQVRELLKGKGDANFNETCVTFPSAKEISSADFTKYTQSIFSKLNGYIDYFVHAVSIGGLVGAIGILGPVGLAGGLIYGTYLTVRYKYIQRFLQPRN